MTTIKIVKKGTIKPAKPFTTLEEEAHYWDTHSFVKEPNTNMYLSDGSKSSKLTVRFDPNDVVKIRTEAKKRGVGPTTLIRMWIMEKLVTV